ncbi:hypothetical protein [Hyphomicrobium sulfonivorans]|uniref:hypothetical protein n=1 Tax=Hyphomicrobium sulfonivorans TaxID=121290 RepID=UPI001AEC7018|nr:hypothetical protein [Hyphomicrobium sulfonivorans]
MRVIAALFASYLATWSMAYAAALLLPTLPTETVIITSVVGILVYVALMLWAFVAGPTAATAASLGICFIVMITRSLPLDFFRVSQSTKRPPKHYDEGAMPANPPPKRRCNMAPKRAMKGPPTINGRPMTEVERLEHGVAQMAYIVLRHGKVYAPLLERLEGALDAARNGPEARARRILEDYMAKHGKGSVGAPLLPPAED